MSLRKRLGGWGKKMRFGKGDVEDGVEGNSKGGSSAAAAVSGSGRESSSSLSYISIP